MHVFSNQFMIDTVNMALTYYYLCEAEGIALKYTLCETLFH